MVLTIAYGHVLDPKILQMFKAQMSCLLDSFTSWEMVHKLMLTGRIEKALLNLWNIRSRMDTTDVPLKKLYDLQMASLWQKMEQHAPPQRLQHLRDLVAMLPQ